MLELDELLLLLLLDELLEELLDELLEELLDELLEELPPPWTFFSSSGFSLRMISAFPVGRRLEEPMMGSAGRSAGNGRACRRDDVRPIPREYRSGVEHCRDPRSATSITASIFIGAVGDALLPSGARLA